MRKETSNNDDSEHVYEIDERGHETKNESSRVSFPQQQETAIEQGRGGNASKPTAESNQHGRDSQSRNTQDTQAGAAPRQVTAVEQSRTSNLGNTSNLDNASIGALLKRLVGDATTLVSKEMELARSELSQAVSTAGKAATSLVTGALVLYAGFLFLLGAAYFGLAIVVDPWLSALIVGGVVAVIGLIMVMVGKKKMNPANFNMARTSNSLQRDREMAQGASR